MGDDCNTDFNILIFLVFRFLLVLPRWLTKTGGNLVVLQKGKITFTFILKMCFFPVGIVSEYYYLEKESKFAQFRAIILQLEVFLFEW